MISLLGTLIGASWPVFLAAIPIGLGALLYLYRAKGTGQPQVISTLFLLSRMPHYTPSRRRFVLPLQFWIEVALVVVLALAASRIQSSKVGSRVALVIDTSKSMGALVSADETRLDVAIRIASADIAQASSDTVFTLLHAGRELTAQERSGAYTRVGKRDVQAALETLQPTYEVDFLEGNVSDLLVHEGYDSVWVYTDRVLDSETVDSRLQLTTVPLDPELVHNTWISAVQVVTDKQSDAQTIDVGIMRVGKGASLDISVNALCTDRESDHSFNLSSVKQSLRPDHAALIRIGKIPHKWSYCRLSIEGTGGDLLPRDDEAWVVNTTEVGAIGLVSAMSAKALGLEHLPYGAFVALEDQSNALDRNVSTVIYHRSAPVDLSRVSSLIVYPDTGVTVLDGRVGAEVRNGAALDITRWDETHPILQYAQPGLLTIPTARVLECPASARSIMHSSSGPIMCAGEEKGRRYVVFGFEILPFEGRRTATLSIITLNALQWLLEANGITQQAEQFTGALVLSQADAVATRSVRMIAPRTEELNVSESGSIIVSSPGIIEIADTIGEKQDVRLIAVNALSDQESNLLLRNPLEFSSEVFGANSASNLFSSRDSKQSRRDTGSETTHYESFFAWLALCLLTIDVARRFLSAAAWRERV